jgi:hypothetical protein
VSDLERMPVGSESIHALTRYGGPSVPRFLPGAPFNAVRARLRAQLNHCGQAPEELAKRGGVSFVEALCILADVPFRAASTYDEAEAPERLRVLLGDSLPGAL